MAGTRRLWRLIPTALVLLFFPLPSKADIQEKVLELVARHRDTGYTTGAWTITDRWDEEAELEFADFVEAFGVARETIRFKNAEGLTNPAVNILWTEEDSELEVEVDCANLPYLLRGYFAYKTGRPFAYMGNKGNRYGKHNRPKVLRDFSDHPTFKELIEDVIHSVSSAHFRMHADYEATDLYPIDPTYESVMPGVVYYDPNGHVLMVYKIDREKGEIFMLDGHPDGTISRKVWGASYARGSARFAGGFKAWRHDHVEVINRETGEFSIWRDLNAEAPHFSNSAQYQDQYWLDGLDMTYHEWVRARVSRDGIFVDPLDGFDRMLSGFCGDVRDRVGAVQSAVNAGLHEKAHPNELPWNIYGADGQWEKYSSPGRDARLRFKAREFKRFVIKVKRWAQKGDRRLQYDGTAEELCADLTDMWTESLEGPECTIQYRNSEGEAVTLTLADVLDRLYDLSFDPYHCPELRWGAPMVGADGEPTPEFATCPQDRRKVYWYEKEARLRNRHTRLLRKATMVHRGPEEGESVDVLSLLECPPALSEPVVSHEPK